MPSPTKVNVIEALVRLGLKEGDRVSPSRFAKSFKFNTNYIYRLFRRWQRYGYFRRVKEGRFTYYEVTRKGEEWLDYYYRRFFG